MVLWHGILKDGRKGIVERAETRKTKEDFYFEEIERRKDQASGDSIFLGGYVFGKDSFNLKIA